MRLGDKEPKHGFTETCSKVAKRLYCALYGKGNVRTEAPTSHRVNDKNLSSPQETPARPRSCQQLETVEYRELTAGMCLPCPKVAKSRSDSAAATARILDERSAYMSR